MLAPLISQPERYSLHGRSFPPRLAISGVDRPFLNSRAICYTGSMIREGSMTREQVKEILDRVLTWPLKRQEDAVRLLSEMERQDTSSYHLTDKQVEEVERRRADFAEGRERYATDEEMAAFWQKCGL